MAKQMNMGHRKKERRVSALGRLLNPSDTVINKVLDMDDKQKKQHRDRVNAEIKVLKERI